VRVVFLGTPDFAVASLDALLRGPDEVVAVVTQPSRPQGRGLASVPTPVAARAAEAGVPVLAPEKLHTPEVIASLRGFAADLFVTCAYGRILRRSILELPALGSWNVHASLLPRLRGASPIPRAILEGDAWTGVTIFQLDEGMDTGPLLLQKMERIRPDDTTGSLSERLSLLGANALCEACDAIRSGNARLRPQDDAHASHAPILAKEDGLLSWNRPADLIERFVRAMDPLPGATARFRGQPLRIRSARPLDLLPCEAPPGTLVALDPAPTVAALPGRIALAEVQAAGRRAMSAADWARGVRPEIGESLA
jgi:methionyl-tRNA formyltransferase